MANAFFMSFVKFTVFIINHCILSEDRVNEG